MREIWRRIPGHPGYDVSSRGRIRSWLAKKNHIIKNPGPPYYKQPTAHPRGPYVNLQRKVFRVGYLVAIAFRGPPPQRNSVEFYLDGNRQNVQLNNIAWVPITYELVEKLVARAVRRRK